MGLLWQHAHLHKLVKVSALVWASVCVCVCVCVRAWVCVCDSAGSGGYFTGAVFIFSHNTLQQLQPILTSQTHLFSFMKWCQNSMATTLPVALGLLTRKRRGAGVPYAHTHNHTHTRYNTGSIRPVCQSRFSLHDRLGLKHNERDEENVTNIK